MGNLYWGFSLALNGDTLHLPMMFEDWISGRLHWIFWSLPPARYLFPDIPLYFFLRLLTSEGVLAMLLNVWLNFFCILFLTANLLKLTLNLPLKKGLPSVLLAFTIFTIPQLVPIGAVMGAFWPTFHSGAILWSLLAFNCLFLWLRRSTILGTIGLMGSIFLVGFSDPIVFTIFEVPILGFLLFYQGRPWTFRLWSMVAVVLLCAAGGWVGDRLTPWTFFQFKHHAMPLLPDLIKGMVCFGRDLLKPEATFGILAFLSGGGLLLFKLRGSSLNRGLWVGLFLLILTPIIGAIFIGRYVDLYNWRYFPLSILLPIIALVFAFFHRKIIMATVCFSVFTLSLIYVPQWPAWADLTYPSDVRQLDSLRDRLGLKGGLAEYWLAKPMRYFSRVKVPVYPIDHDGLEYLKVVNLAWLGISFTPPPTVDYNFIITQDLDPSVLLGCYGEPVRIYPFHGEKGLSQLWIYDYNLGTVLAKDETLWKLISLRLNEYGYLVSRAELESIAKILLHAVLRQEKTHQSKPDDARAAASSALLPTR